jgi:hypothetical protein
MASWPWILYIIIWLLYNFQVLNLKLLRWIGKFSGVLADKDIKISEIMASKVVIGIFINGKESE